MTALKLQKVLGRQIEIVESLGDDRNKRQDALAQAEAITKLARQCINNSQVLLRADGMLKDGKLRKLTLKNAIGEEP